MSGDDARRDAAAGSLFADVPERLAVERFDPLLDFEHVRIERIVSTGQTTAPGDWYDQPWDEWILVVAGTAEILLDKEDAPRLLRPGDYLFLPAHVRHRVTRTDLERPRSGSPFTSAAVRATRETYCHGRALHSPASPEGRSPPGPGDGGADLRAHPSPPTPASAAGSASITTPRIGANTRTPGATAHGSKRLPGRSAGTDALGRDVTISAGRSPKRGSAAGAEAGRTTSFSTTTANHAVRNPNAAPSFLVRTVFIMGTGHRQPPIVPHRP